MRDAMQNGDPRSCVDKAIGLCFGILAGAAALYIAVRLIQAVAAVLLVILAIGVFIAVAAFLLRSRNRGW